MYMKLEIFTQSNTFKILEQKDTPSREVLCEAYGIIISSISCPDLVYLTENELIFYIRGSNTRKDFTVMNYKNNDTLNKIFKALATIATVDIVWS